MIFSEHKTKIRENLNDAGVSFVATSALDDSVQDAYDDIALLTGCIVKKSAGLSWTANLSYYDFSSIVSDFLVCLAIFNNVNNRWVDDDLSLRNFELCRDDWELAIGTPRNWAANGDKLVAFFPKYSTAAGTYDLIYGGKAPTVADADEPLIVPARQKLIQLYSTADILESNQEFNKAMAFWNDYYAEIEAYKDQVKKLAKSDLTFLLSN